MRALATTLALAGLLSACDAQPPAARWSADDVAAAEAHAERLLGFNPGRAKADFARLTAVRPASGAVLGKPVQCAVLADPTAIGRKPGRDRVLVIGEGQIADAPSHEREFQILWDVAGC